MTSAGDPEKRDPLGLVRRYRRRSDGQVAARLRELLPPERALRRLDVRGVATAWGEHPECEATCFHGIDSLPRGLPAAATLGTFSHDPRAGERALLDAAAAMLPSAGPLAVALSGGLDSALVLALLREAGAKDIHLYTVSTGFPGYDELDWARATAQSFGLPLHEIHVEAASFLAVLPQAIAACETALYNLHPVERFLLARAIRDRGHSSLITGDGADQVFAGAPPAIFLPLLSALFEDAGVALRSPFFDPTVVSWGLSLPVDPGKTLLRACASRWGVPAFVLDRPKHVRLTPALDLAGFLDVPRLGPLATALGRSLALDTDRLRVQWATLGLLWEAF